MPRTELILIVDDHPDARDGMRHMLEREGYAVATAGNGSEALRALFAGLQPCVILMDLMMPVMNGFEFRQEQLKHRAIADIPFIAYSAVVDVRKHAHHLNADGYVEKPMDFQQVLSLIRQVCALTAAH